QPYHAPARQSVAERGASWAQMDPAVAAALQATLAQSLPPPPAGSDPLIGLVEQQVTAALQQTLAGEQSAAAALNAAQAAIMTAVQTTTPAPTPLKGRFFTMTLFCCKDFWSTSDDPGMMGL
ncbi:MAG: hypothetical protein MI924_13140, partial [Chloroflexales bacterium]|nr:hypothetical protein [Chloroflexales bacterium]